MQVKTKGIKIVSTITVNGIFVLISLICVVPLLLVLSASFTTDAALSANGYALIPKEFSVSAYSYIFRKPQQIINAYQVTILVTVVGTLISLLCTGMFGYVISRKDYALQKLFSFILLFTLLFNGGMVPSYIMITRYYHLKDTLLVLILPGVISPWNVFLMRGFFSDLSSSLIDAAKIDGASETRIFFRIIVPISKPAFATIGLFVAFAYWNDWWRSLLYIDNPRLVSLQFYLYRIMANIQLLLTTMREVGSSAVNIAELPGETARMALCVLAAGPMLFIFPFFQKYFVRGLTIGAVKG
ncbi:MAG: carbohydrate ABC transporter permease [Treponema sp.]|jgi:putative aldouronate transport system permease protein|nr:carbohydrate ABC transporter permease [Treponema sp.]